MAHISKQPIDPALQADENAKKIAELEAQLDSLSQRFETMNQRWVNTYAKSDNTSLPETQGFKIVLTSGTVNVFVFYQGMSTKYGFFNAHIHEGKLYYTPEQEHEGLVPLYDKENEVDCINVPTGPWGRITVISDRDFSLIRY